MELLKKLYKVYSPSGKERTMIKFIWNYTKRITGTKVETDAAGNLYITKGEAESYPCIVAHLDQMQRLHSKDFTTVETGEIIFGYSSRNKRQEGLGADDKNGIWIALKCLRKYDSLKLAFFVSEEVGCVGSGKAVMDFSMTAALLYSLTDGGIRTLLQKSAGLHYVLPNSFKLPDIKSSDTGKHME